MAREGIGTVLASALMALVVTAGAAVTGAPGLVVLTALLWLAVGLVVYFFRDPPRHPPLGESLVLSPADGRVVVVFKEEAREFLSGEVWRIAVFLSLLDVHVIRSPITGRVGYFRYQKGRFAPARREEAGQLNEQVVLGIEGGQHKVLLQLIAGVVARRVVCHPREGWCVEKGQRIGIIRFGSRVELTVPGDASVQVRLGQKVRAGETVIARIGRE
ncbi:MAG: phosphatidylserine decarboxylase [Calditrichaeota bacterium]|nr:phosphatidylserine decarboxylase [Calditrichota bacterium]